MLKPLALPATLAACLAAGCAAAPQAQKTASADTASPPGLVCAKERRIGTNIAVETCTSAEQRREQKNEADALRESMRITTPQQPR